MKTLLVAMAIVGLIGCEKTYTDPYGNEITKAEHERRVANDAAHDALINLMIECKSNPGPQCPASND